jgi:hypothetical protein
MKGCGTKVWIGNSYFTCGEDYGQGIKLCEDCNNLLEIVIPISNFLSATKKIENSECHDVALDIVKRLNQSGYKIVKLTDDSCDVCNMCEDCEFIDFYDEVMRNEDDEYDEPLKSCEDCDQFDECDAYDDHSKDN